MIATSLLAMASLTNCKVEEEDLENNCFKVTAYSTILVDYSDADIRDDFYYFQDNYLYTGYEKYDGTWYVDRTPYSISDKKIVDKTGISYKIKKGGDLLTIKADKHEKLELTKTKMPTEMAKAIADGDFIEVSGFSFDYSWTDGWF